MELMQSEQRADAVLERDADAIPQYMVEARPFPSTSRPRGQGLQVVCSGKVLQAIRRHGGETHEVEVCGVLVGNVWRDDEGPFLWIEECIRGEHAVHQLAQVTFTSETWTHIHDELAKLPDMRILGWYHTHPDFGIFLSAADLFIHENFFNLPWQVAYVYDPVRDEDGMFVWRKGKAEQEPYCVYEDTNLEESDVRVGPTQLAPRDERAADLERRVRRLERRSAVLAFMMIVLSLALSGTIALAWPDLLHRLQQLWARS